jgi:hypothetical protein
MLELARQLWTVCLGAQNHDRRGDRELVSMEQQRVVLEESARQQTVAADLQFQVRQPG